MTNDEQTVSGKYSQPARILLACGVASMAMLPISYTAALAQAPEAQPAVAATATATAASPNDDRCRQVRRLLLREGNELPVQVRNSKSVPATAGHAPECIVEGYILPSTQFALRLPATGWNGKFLQRACTGWCGSVDQETCDESVRRGYACLVYDGGHTAGGEGRWGWRNLETKIDFGFRSLHAASVAGKALTNRYYGVKPRASYLVGCSTGGRLSLLAAQRFPLDFDGIIAGSPVVNEWAADLQTLWSLLANTRDGRSILTISQVDALHSAVLRGCDAQDGLADGIVSDPFACRFDPAEIACKVKKADGCLTPEAVEAARKIYSAPRMPDGTPLNAGGMPLGSELDWKDFIVPSSGEMVLAPAEEFFKYLGFPWDPGADWKASDFDFGRDPASLAVMQVLYDASNPDLRAFKSHGGKLIMFQGTLDTALIPARTIDYYETAARTMGGYPATADFFRMFLIPGMGHCGGGGADTVDYLGALDAWVSNGKAPDMLIGTSLKEDVEGAARPAFPIPVEKAAFQRPHYPYPYQARYKGGDVNSAASFRPEWRPVPGSTLTRP